MPRLFVGLELPREVRERLAVLSAPLPGARWIAPENMHVTLRFAGDVDAPTARELMRELSRIEMPGFELRIAGLGVFGGRDPRSLWAGVERSEPLERLQRAAERACRAAGLPPDPRNFEPHVTLARLKGTRPDVLARFLGDRGGLLVRPFRVTRFVLFNSRPSVGGGPYGITASYPFLGEIDEDHHDEAYGEATEARDRR